MWCCTKTFTIVILRAHRPHDSNTISCFAYCRDDGFVIFRYSGIMDRNKKWDIIKPLWFNAFKKGVEEYFIYKALYDNKLTTVENKIMEKLKYIFDITYGTKLDKNKTIEQNDKPCLCRYHNKERRS